MNLGSVPARERLRSIISSRSFWGLLLVLAATTVLHYCTPQIRLLDSYPITRHAIERIAFMGVVVGATFSFGHSAGLVTLTIVALLMLPRALLVSPLPLDASGEVFAIAVVGYLVIRMSARERRTASRLKTINATTKVLIQSLELEEILNSVLDKILAAMEIESAGIYLLDQETEELTLAAHRNLPAEVVGAADGLKSAALLANHDHLRYQLSVPLRSKGRANGILVLASPEPRASLRREVKLVTTICNEVGVVVENAQLFQDIARQLEVTRCVCEVVEEINIELELDRVLPKVMRIAEELAEADAGVVALWDEERDVITYPYLHNFPGELTQVTVSEGQGLAGEVMATGQGTVIDDYQAYEGAVPAFAEVGVYSVVGVPIVSGTRTFGALCLCTIKRSKKFSARDVTILTAIGRQAGIAIENAYLYESMRFYARRITRAQENERRRIARELHDDTIQSLIVLSRRLDSFVTSNGRLLESEAPGLVELRDLAGEVIKSVRRFSQDLRPSILDDLGLLPALEELTSDLERLTDLRAEFHTTGDKRRLSSEVELTLFRIAQEALSNVRRHADATSVALSVVFDDNAVRVTVDDDGRGFVPPRLGEHPVTTPQLGLVGMYERARLVGGTLTVRSMPGKGTTVAVRVPV